MPKVPHLPLMPLIIGSVILALTYLGFTTTRYIVHNSHLHAEETQLRSDIAQAGRDHEQLTAVRDYLKSDEYVEDVARRVLGLVRPGETLVIVSGSERAPSATAASGTPPAEWWKSLFVAPAVTPMPSGRQFDP